MTIEVGKKIMPKHSIHENDMYKVLENSMYKYDAGAEPRS